MSSIRSSHEHPHRDRRETSKSKSERSRGSCGGLSESQDAQTTCTSVIINPSRLSERSQDLVRAAAMISKTLKELEGGIYAASHHTETKHHKCHHHQHHRLPSAQPPSGDLHTARHETERAHLKSANGHVENPTSIFTSGSPFGNAHEKGTHLVTQYDPNPIKPATQVSSSGTSNSGDDNQDNGDYRSVSPLDIQPHPEQPFEGTEKDGNFTSMTTPDDGPSTFTQENQSGMPGCDPKSSTAKQAATSHHSRRRHDCDSKVSESSAGVSGQENIQFMRNGAKQSSKVPHRFSTTNGISSSSGSKSHNMKIEHRLKQLENENWHLKARVQAQESIDLTLVANLQKKLSALEEFNKRTATDEIPNQHLPALHEQDPTISFLKRKIQLLEKENAKSMNTSSKEEKHRLNQANLRCRALESDNQDLQMRVSRHHIEIKSLLEQNEILKRENKRLIEQEIDLKGKLLHLEEAKRVRPASEGVATPEHDTSGTRHLTDSRSPSQSHQKLREDILRLINDESRRIRDQKYQVTLNRSSATFPVRNLDALLEVLETLRVLVTSPNPGEAKLLSIGSQLVEAVGVTSHAYLSALDQALELDQRVMQIQEEGSKMRQETERTVKKITKVYERDMRGLRAENQALASQLEIMKEEVRGFEVAYLEEQDRCIDEVAKAREIGLREHSELHDAIHELNRKDRHQITTQSQELLLQEQLKNAQSERIIAELTAQSDQIRSHRTHLEDTIEKWKRENTTLQESCEKSRTAMEASQLEVGQMSAVIKDLESRLEDEILRGKNKEQMLHVIEKELATTRQDVDMKAGEGEFVAENANRPGKCLQGIEKILATRLQEFTKVNSGQGLPSNSGGVAGFENLVSVLVEKQESGQELEQLHTMVEEHVQQLDTLRRENTQLRQRLMTQKDGLKTREECWVNKLKVIQSSLAELQAQHQTLESLLTDYEKQFQYLNTLLHPTTSLATWSKSEHPLPFAQTFSDFYSDYLAVKEGACVLTQKLEATTTNVQTRTCQIETLTSRLESDRDRITSLERALEKELCKSKEVQERLRFVEQQKTELEGKMNRIMAGLKKLFYGPIL
ncbi:hypothetical protein DFS34DRAFT_606105 [Phlyctochytrium arcticum]|nr:hypothetical protein DFS34DRAFT_640852 [Phlyctochytrium arcticum]KAI9103847.1 hypothetical protein DFS34DRAFT_606105 [Phlyctochytrium arcticum]